MADEIVTFGESERSRIHQSVQATEAGDQIGRGLSGAALRLARFVFQIKLGKADADIAKGFSGTISEYVGTTAGSESDTGDNYTCYNRFGAITSGKWVIFVRFMGNWHIIMAEC